MSQQLTKNKWGFSVEKDNPFAIFRVLQGIALKSVGAGNVIDLSRGDPGYGFTPSVKGRRFYSYLLNLDTHFNNAEIRFSHMDKDFKVVWQGIEDFTKSVYVESEAMALLGDLEMFVRKVMETASGCELEWSEMDVLHRMFNHGKVSGGSYMDPQGEELVRVVLADWYRKFIAQPLDHEDFILFNGASHAIGTLFKSLGREGVNFLNEDSMVVVSSPVYSPYNASLLNRGVQSFVFAIDPLTGDLEEDSLRHLETYNGKIDALILVDPSNPTGFSMSEDALEKIADVAKHHDSIVISDEVYSSFFAKKRTIVDYCPERVLRIDARSKIERSTGLRFGDLFISKQANDYISNKILHKYLLNGMDLKSYLIQAKGPGGSEGELQHTTFVPGPSQYLGICHMVMADEERQKYFEDVHKNGDFFTDELGLQHEGNLYYVIFDLNMVEGSKKQDVSIEEKLTELAKRGVVYIPANLFFSENERTSRSLTNMVRASVVNTTPENVRKAAKITKDYLTK